MQRHKAALVAQTRRSARRHAIASRRKGRRHSQRRPGGRWPFGGPSISTVRRWLKQLEAAGLAERVGVERTGKPGRPAHLWQATEAARNRPQSELSVREQINVLRVERLLRRARGKALTEDQIWEAYNEAMPERPAA